MIKAKIVLANGDQIAILGLVGENMARLMADEPIVLDLADIGLAPQEIWIIGGPSEDAITAHLTKAIGQPRVWRDER